MHRIRLTAWASLIFAYVLAVILLGMSCDAAASGDSPALGTSSSPGSTSTGRPGDSAGSGIGGCTALLEARRAASPDYPMIRSQFARSRWPDVRAAGVSYVELIVKLQDGGADGYETVWFYQRLSRACTRHGWKPVSFVERSERRGARPKADGQGPSHDELTLDTVPDHKTPKSAPRSTGTCPESDGQWFVGHIGAGLAGV